VRWGAEWGCGGVWVEGWWVVSFFAKLSRVLHGRICRKERSCEIKKCRTKKRRGCLGGGRWSLYGVGVVGVSRPGGRRGVGRRCLGGSSGGFFVLYSGGALRVWGAAGRRPSRWGVWLGKGSTMRCGVCWGGCGVGQVGGSVHVNSERGVGGVSSRTWRGAGVRKGVEGWCCVRG